MEVTLEIHCTRSVEVTMALSIPDQLKQLDSARQIVLGDAALYPQIVTHILPIVGAGAQLELRRWGANFLAETFGSPVVPAKSKEQMGITALQTMKEILESSGAQDTEVVKGIIQASASIYDPIFKYMYVQLPPHPVVCPAMHIVDVFHLRFI